MPEQKLIDKKGGTMRLGQYPCHIADDSLALKAYGQNNISERHRHRYEVNNDYRERLEAAGVRFTGLSPDNRLCEIAEIPGKRWFLGTQFHPELKSRPNHPQRYSENSSKPLKVRRKKDLERSFLPCPLPS
ncbi:MAG: glutamine amidotransferase-related protein [Eubacteriales bacterium]